MFKNYSFYAMGALVGFLLTAGVLLTLKNSESTSTSVTGTDWHCLQGDFPQGSMLVCFDDAFACLEAKENSPSDGTIGDCTKGQYTVR